MRNLSASMKKITLGSGKGFCCPHKPVGMLDMRTIAGRVVSLASQLHAHG